MVPTRDECLRVLRKYEVNEFVILHSLAVADVTRYLAQLVQAYGQAVNPDMAEAAALLHDVGKGELASKRFPGSDHAKVSARVVDLEGFRELAPIVEKHMLNSMLGGKDQPQSWEEQLLWYADKTTLFRFMGIDARFHDLLARHPDEKGTIAGVLPRARQLEERIFSCIGAGSFRPSLVRRLVSRHPAGYMETAIGTTYDYSVNIHTMMHDVAKVGFRSVSLGGGNLNHSCYHTADGRKNLLRLKDETGVSISSLHAPFKRDISSEDDDERQAAVGDVLMACGAAAELGADVVIIHPHGFMESASPGKIARAILSVGQILRRCPEDVKVAVENLPSPGTESVLSALLDTYSPDRLGFCYDTSHHNLCPKEFDFLGAFGERLISVHISDNRGERDDHQIPGEGVVNWKSFARSFGCLDFPGPFLLEVETRMSRHKNPLEFLEEAFDRAEWLLALCDRLGELR